MYMYHINGVYPIKLLNINDLEHYARQKRKVNIKHPLWFLFKRGTTCVYCKEEGVFLIEGINEQGVKSIGVFTKHFKRITVDHIIPKKLGGTNLKENLVVCCSDCNQLKGSNLILTPINNWSF